MDTLSPKFVRPTAGMAASDSADLYELCERITSQFLPNELSDFRNEGKLRIEHSLKYPKAYSSEKTFGVLSDSSSGVRTDEFSPTDVQIFEEGLKCIPLIVAAVKAIVEFRNQRMSSNPKHEQVAALKNEWANYLGRFNFPAETAREITNRYVEDLAKIAAK